jgi:hypothetical protein
MYLYIFTTANNEKYLTVNTDIKDAIGDFIKKKSIRPGNIISVKEIVDIEVPEDIEFIR